MDNEQKTNHVILKKIWTGRGVVQNTYVKIPHQSDEGAEKYKEFLLSDITRLQK